MQVVFLYGCTIVRRYSVVGNLPHPAHPSNILPSPNWGAFNKNLSSLGASHVDREPPLLEQSVEDAKP